jgi:glycosyltransferase involved in cell wall biosynthesis
MVFFSVIINCHNAGEFLSDAVDSVLGQTFSDYEIIIYDNASTDDTAKIAAKYGERVAYHYSERKLKLGTARNQAIQHASGKYLAFLDSDDVWIENKLEKQYFKIACTEEPVGLCGCDAMRVDSKLIPIMKYSTGRQIPSADTISRLVRDCFIPMSSVVVRRDLFLGLGGFNSHFEIIEEWDLWLRAAVASKLIYLDECLVNIRFHSNNTSRDYHAQQTEIRIMFSNLSKNLGVSKNIVTPALAVWELRYNIVCLINYRKESPLNILKSIARISKLLLLRPKASMSLIWPYFSYDLMKFAKIKYLK